MEIVEVERILIIKNKYGSLYPEILFYDPSCFFFSFGSRKRVNILCEGMDECC